MVQGLNNMISPQGPGAQMPGAAAMQLPMSPSYQPYGAVPQAPAVSPYIPGVTGYVAPTILPPVVQTAAGPLAQSFPVTPYAGGIPKPNEYVPTPYELAPNLFFPQRQSVVVPNNAPSYYNYSPTNYAAGYPYPQAPAAQNLPPTPKQPEATPPPTPPPKSPPEVESLVSTQLTPVVVRRVSAQLDGDKFQRELAMKQLASIVSSDPNLLLIDPTDPMKKDYAEALLLKALRPSESPQIRQILLAPIAAGGLNYSTPRLLNALKVIAGQEGLFNFEAEMAHDALRNLKMKEMARLQQQKQASNVVQLAGRRLNQMSPSNALVGQPMMPQGNQLNLMTT